MGKKTSCLILILALCCALQVVAAEPSSGKSTGCALTPARLGALVEAPSLCAPEPEVSPVAAAQEDIFGGSETQACCSIAFRQECIATYGSGCAHWYCESGAVCFCENLC